MDRCSNESFLKACGLSRPLELKFEGYGINSRTFELPFVVVGRDPGTDLVVDHPTVSRRHAYLQVIAGRVFCVDMGSRTGVGWERGPDRSGWVDGQRGVRIGPVRIRTGDEAEPVDLGNPLTARSLEDTPLPAVTLEFPQEPERPAWRAVRVLALLGRSPECRLRFSNPEISKFSCSLLRTPAGVWVVDLLGRTEVELNGQRIRWARLEDGDRLQVGRYQFRVRCEMPHTDPSGQGSRAVGALAVVNPRAERLATIRERGKDRTLDPLAPPLPWLPAPGAGAGLLDDLAPSKAELVEPLMAHMATQFGQLQQQMFDRFGQMQQQMSDQYQQAMMMMAQMFGTLQRDQMDLVREELARLHQLNHDLHALQSELAARSPAAAAPGPVDTAMAETLARIEAMLRTAPPLAGTPPGAAPASPASRGPGSARTPSPLPPREGQPGAIPNGTNANGFPSTATPDPDSLPDEAVHTLILQRIAMIHHERQTRWQRILGLVMGR